MPMGLRSRVLLAGAAVLGAAVGPLSYHAYSSLRALADHGARPATASLAAAFYPRHLLEDEEDAAADAAIRAALEHMGAEAARSVWADLRADAASVRRVVLTLVARTCPARLLLYPQDPARLVGDLERLALALLLGLWGCVVLAPRAGRPNHNSHHNHHKGTTGATTAGSLASSAGAPPPREDAAATHPLLSRAGLPSPGQSAAGSGSMPADDSYGYRDDETDEERFERFYESLDPHSYLRRLMLPPTCRLVEKPARTSVVLKQGTKDKPEPPATEPKPQASPRSDAEENPAQRLAYYVRHVLHFLRAIVWFDYVAAGWTLLYWLQGIQRQRRVAAAANHQSIAANGSGSTEVVEETETEDDRETASVVERKEGDANLQSPRSPQYHPTISQQPAAATTNDPIADDKSDRVQEDKSESGSVRPPALLVENFPEEQNNNRYLSNVAEGSHEFTNSDSESEHMTRSVATQSTCSQSTRPAAKAPASGSGSSRGRFLWSSSAQPKRDALDAWRTPRHSLDLKPSFVDNWPSAAESPLVIDSPMNEGPANGGATPRVTRPQHEQSEDPTVTDNETHDEECSGRFYFDTEHSDVALKRLLIDIPVPDKNGYILGDHFLSDPKNMTPLLVFVNSRSGPQQGHLIITQLRRLLNPIQIWDLANGGPEAVLESFLVLTRLRILVCGGDGTVSWIIFALEQMKLQRRWPPIAILPLGTGNDLARMHGWGGGYNNESLLVILEQISESYISLLDRWDVTIEEKQSKKKEKKCFMNYLGVGADAQAALQVHYLRESRPDWFFSRLINKIWYGVFGAEDIIMASSVNVRKEIKLVADGVHIPLPADSQGIILLNIDSYAGGVPMWAHGVKDSHHSPRRSRSFGPNGYHRHHGGELGDRTDSVDDLKLLDMTDAERYEHVTACDRPSSCQDSILEIVSIRGAFHLGQIRVGLGNAQRLCQCREAVITIKNKVAVQIDGEPWKQRPCTIKVVRKPEHAVMLHRSMDDGGVETEMSKLLEWAEEHQLIDRQVHAVLMKEFSRRIESKTRQRRVRGQENIVATLKKAISQNALAANLNMNTSHNWQGGMGF